MLYGEDPSEPTVGTRPSTPPSPRGAIVETAFEMFNIYGRVEKSDLNCLVEFVDIQFIIHEDFDHFARIGICCPGSNADG